MAKLEELLETLQSKNLVDDRKMAVIANAKSLPDGSFGLCILCMNGHILSAFDTDFSQNLGSQICQIDLHEVTGFKSSSFVFNRYIKFEFNAFTYKFADFGNAKAFIDALTSDMK